MFHTVNPTDKYIIAIDSDIAILCNHKDRACAIYNQVSSIEESYFGAIRMVPPRHIDSNIYGEIASISILDGRKIVNDDYITKNTARCNARYAGRNDLLTTTTIQSRLADAKRDLLALLGLTSTHDWRANRICVA